MHTDGRRGQRRQKKGLGFREGHLGLGGVHKGDAGHEGGVDVSIRSRCEGRSGDSGGGVAPGAPPHFSCLVVFEELLVFLSLLGDLMMLCVLSLQEWSTAAQACRK